MFKKDLIFQPKTVVHCPEKWQAEKLCKWLDSIGKKWCSGARYSQYTFWESHKTETCYNCYEGMFGVLDTYKNLGFTILNFKDVYNKKQKEEETMIQVKIKTIIEPNYIIRKFYYGNYADTSFIMRNEEGQLTIGWGAAKLLARKVFTDLTEDEIKNAFGSTELPSHTTCNTEYSIKIPKSKVFIKETTKKVLDFLRMGLQKCKDLSEEKSLKNWLWDEKSITL